MATPKSEARSPSPRPSPPGEGGRGGDCPCERAGENIHRPDCLYYVKPISAADIERLVKAAVDAKMAEIARVTPRRVFDGDDALFLSWMSGFVAGHHSANPQDKYALEIFNRARTVLDKLASIAVPPGGNAS